MAIHRSQMTERQLEANMMFWNFWRAKKRAREEGRMVIRLARNMSRIFTCLSFAPWTETSASITRLMTCRAIM